MEDECSQQTCMSGIKSSSEISTLEKKNKWYQIKSFCFDQCATHVVEPGLLILEKCLVQRNFQKLTLF